MVGARQAVEWLDSAVRGMEAGSTKKVPMIGATLSLERVVRASMLSDYSPRPLPGIRKEALERLAAIDTKNANYKARKERKKQEREATEAVSEAGDVSVDGVETDTARAKMPGSTGGSISRPSERSVASRSSVFEEDDGAAKWEGCEARAAYWRNLGNDIMTGVAMPEGKGHKQMRQAVSHYYSALAWNERAASRGLDEGQAVDFAVKVLGNIAMAMSRMNEWRGVLMYCDAVQELDGTNAKAVYRRGQAYSRLKLFVAAEKELRRALEMKPDDRAMKSELAACRKDTVKLLRMTRKGFSETYNFMCKSPLYCLIDEDDAKNRDTGRVSGFSRGFMG